MTKAAASAARAQPAKWCDRKYDKHLSYSATWGRSAGRAGSRGVGVGGKNPTPRRGAPLPRGFGDAGPGRARAAAAAAGALTPRRPRRRVNSPRYPLGGRGAPAGAGVENAPGAWWPRPRPGYRKGSPSQQYFSSRTGGPSCILRARQRRGADRAASRPPAQKESTKVGRARLGDAGGPQTPVLCPEVSSS